MKGYLYKIVILLKKLLIKRMTRAEGMRRILWELLDGLNPSDVIMLKGLTAHPSKSEQPGIENYQSPIILKKKKPLLVDNLWVKLI